MGGIFELGKQASASSVETRTYQGLQELLHESFWAKPHLEAPEAFRAVGLRCLGSQYEMPTVLAQPRDLGRPLTDQMASKHSSDLPLGYLSS
jgi:hypothetical protein